MMDVDETFVVMDNIELAGVATCSARRSMLHRVASY